MITSLFTFLVLVMPNYCMNIDSKCLKLDVSITQKVENEGFHRCMNLWYNLYSCRHNNLATYGKFYLIYQLYKSATLYRHAIDILFLYSRGQLNKENINNLHQEEIQERLEKCGEIRWLIETLSPPKEVWINSTCKLALKLDISSGMYVYPDELAELNRTRKLLLHIDGTVDVEAPAHESSEHTVYIYLDNYSIDKMSIKLPVHLRYQRSQITGGYGKVLLSRPSLLVWCPGTLSTICGKGLKVEAPCSEEPTSNCIWKNVTYQSLFDEVELFVPVGDLDDFPLVSIVTLLIGCAGCIYILSILSTMPL